ncbi:acyl-CoA carboxylase subunit epsilon [Nocardiopsis sp. EMB25]|uniref:acyl-CoA carboxylase subunit epsilon n=1 Tax=Nocardiopsis sp. EMB25 TaxID=2835867 RepID=UPI002284C09E|nr:acyl-CoA carboxylase subunit epsilon [Nocardiopsis sp. EMB25]MCY9785784.1 acyl-CoA carboxylase subunit epsilon [Nocardiopsis sp. EMB25]
MSEPKLPPHVVVVRGAPSDEELAALTAVLSARAAARRATDTTRATEPVSGWRDRARNLRTQVPTRPGPGAWRLSTR